MLIFVALLEPCLVNTSMIHRNWGYQGSFPLPEGPGVVIKRGSGVQGGLSGRAKGSSGSFFWVAVCAENKPPQVICFFCVKWREYNPD